MEPWVGWGPWAVCGAVVVGAHNHLQLGWLQAGGQVGGACCCVILKGGGGKPARAWGEVGRLHRGSEHAADSAVSLCAGVCSGVYRVLVAWCVHVTLAVFPVSIQGCVP
jgi:hypothetical protein